MLYRELLQQAYHLASKEPKRPNRSVAPANKGHGGWPLKVPVPVRKL